MVKCVVCVELFVIIDWGVLLYVLFIIEDYC